MKLRLYPAGETALMLRRLLGPLREWSDFLADCRQFKTSIHGAVLLPYATAIGGRGQRPYYRGADIAKFVNDVKKRCPEARPNIDFQYVLVDLDPSDERMWRHKKFRLNGAA